MSAVSVAFHYQRYLPDWHSTAAGLVVRTSGTRSIATYELWPIVLAIRPPPHTGGRSGIYLGGAGFRRQSHVLDHPVHGPQPLDGPDDSYVVVSSSPIALIKAIQSVAGSQ